MNYVRRDAERRERQKAQKEQAQKKTFQVGKYHCIILQKQQQQKMDILHLILRCRYFFHDSLT
jgi:SET domain-containing protein